MKIFATSDTHFGHDKLVSLSHRPVDFGERLLKSISRGKGDMLIHCGDFCIGNDEQHAKAYMEAAKGFKRKVLVRGNHDGKSNAWYYDHGFDFVCEIYLVKLFSKQVLFSHMPVMRNDAFWFPHFPADRNIHGHLHGNNHRNKYLNDLYNKTYLYDLAPEIHDYKIVEVEKILCPSPSKA